MGGNRQSAATHWALDYINSAFAKGWINGYADGTFRPNQHITRAEVITIVNTMLNRNPEELPESIINPFSDIDETHWAYLAVMEASTEHTYERDVLGIEYWTAHECPVTGEWIDSYMPAREDADTEEAENGEDADEDTDGEDEEDDGEEEGDEEDEEEAAA